MQDNIWLVGNSQLHTAILSEFCTAEDFQRFGDDWKNHRVSEGEFAVEQRRFRFLFCNMSTLGDIFFDGQTISHTKGMADFVNRTDPDASTIIVMLRGNEFALESLVETPVPWDFSWAESPATKGRQVVRQRDVLAHFEKVTNALLATCLTYRNAFPNATVCHVAAPPPIECELHIRDNQEGFGPLFEKFGIRPFAVRKKIYDAMYGVLSKNLARFGVKTVFAPTQALTDSGGLRAQFASGCLHGNHHYGRALMAMLDRERLHASV